MIALRAPTRVFLPLDFVPRPVFEDAGVLECYCRRMAVRYYLCVPSRTLELERISQEIAEAHGASSRYLVMPSQNGRDLKGKYFKENGLRKRDIHL